MIKLFTTKSKGMKAIFSLLLAVTLAFTPAMSTAIFGTSESLSLGLSIEISGVQLQKAIDAIGSGDAELFSSKNIPLGYSGIISDETSGFYTIDSGTTNNCSWAVLIDNSKVIKAIVYNNKEDSLNYRLDVQGYSVIPQEMITSYTETTKKLSQEQLDDLDSELITNIVDLEQESDDEKYYRVSYIIQCEQQSGFLSSNSLSIQLFEINIANTFLNDTSGLSDILPMRVNATGFSGEYDGKSHGIYVDAPINATITYGTNANNCNNSSSLSYTNAGTYTVYYKVVEEGYETVIGSQQVKISKALNMQVSAVGYYGIYDARPHSIVVNAISGAEISYGTVLGNYSLNKSPEYYETGEYKIYYSVQHQNYQSVVGEATINITNPIVDATASNYMGLYDGAPHSITVETEADSTVFYGTTKGNYTLTSAPSYTNVGEYTVYYVARKTGYISKQGSAVVTITTSDIMPVSFSAYNGSYDGQEHGITISAPNGSSIMYGTTNGQYTQAQSPTYINTGEYTVYFEVKNPNYTVFTGSSIVSIAPKLDLNISVEGYNGTYDEQTHGIKVTAEPNSTIKYGLSLASITLDQSPVYTNVGTYKVFYRVTNANAVSIYSSALVTITAKENMDVVATGYYGYFDDLYKGISVKAPANSTIKYGTKFGTYDMAESPTHTNAGTYYVYYQVVNSNFSNPFTGVSTIKILPKLRIPLEIIQYNGKYDGEAHSISINAPSKSVIKYGSGDGVYNSTINPSFINAGTYTVYFQVSCDNYTTKSDYAIVNIEKAVHMPISAISYLGSYDNMPHGITVTAPEGSVVKYGTVEGVYNYSESPVYTNLGEYIVYYQSQHKNYENTTGYAKVIIQNTGEIPVEYESYTGTYDGLKHSIKVTSIAGSTIKYGLTISSCTSVDPIEFSDIGTHKVYFLVSHPNYKSLYKSSEITILKGLSMNIPASGYTGIYDENYHGISVSAPSGSTVKFSETEGIYELNSSPEYKNAGLYTVYYQVKHSSYETVTASAKVFIATKNAYINVNNKSKTETAADPIFDGLVTGLLNPTDLGTITYNRILADINKETAGDNITLTSTYEANTNYNVIVVNSKLNILPSSNMQITSTGYTGEYDGNFYGITVVAPSDAIVKFSTTHGNYTLNKSPEYKNTGTYTVYYKADKVGSATAYGSEIVTIAKKSAYITVNAATKTFATKDPEFSGSVSGLIANTDLETIQYQRLDADKTKENVADDINITAIYTNNENYNITLTNSKLKITPASGMKATVTGFTGNYDDKTHSITVQSIAESTIKYGTSSSNYSLTISPTYVNAGSYRVYYEVTHKNYNNIYGYADITINKIPIVVTANSAVYSYDRTYKTVEGIASTQGMLTGHTLTGVTVAQTKEWKVGSYPVVIFTTNWAIMSGSTAVTQNYTLTGVNGTLVINPPNYVPSTSGGTSSPDTNPVATTVTIVDGKTPKSSGLQTISAEEVPLGNLPKSGSPASRNQILLFCIIWATIWFISDRKKLFKSFK